LNEPAAVVGVGEDALLGAGEEGERGREREREEQEELHF